MPCVLFKTFSSETVPAIRLLAGHTKCRNMVTASAAPLLQLLAATENINSITEGKWKPLPIALFAMASTSRPGTLLLICVGFATSGKNHAM